ncbi:MAG: glycosyltransferase [Desulfobacterales bacterium]|nr:glycosyltransferase [Desulfobacterales bacterium]
MKILHIIPNINAKMGGSVYAVINILMLEKNMGIKSTVLSIKADEPDPNLFELATVIILKPSFPKRFSRSKDANKWLGKNAPDYDLAVIHTIWSVLPVEASHILYKLKVPFVIWAHNGLDPFDIQKKKYMKKILGPILIRPMLDKSAAIVCTVRLEAERLERYGAKTEPYVLSYPISPISGLGDRERFREKFSLGDNDFVFLFLSLLYYKKGLNLLIPAIKKVSINYPNIKLIIAGSDLGGYEKKVRAWIQKYELKDRIIMPGFLSGQDKQDAFAGSDCFVLPSMNENFGIAVVEALSAGLPVLISDNVYIWKEIIEEGGGWVCNYSIESLIDSITGILKSPSDLKNKKENSRRSAQLFSPGKLKASYKQFYRQIRKQYDK